MCEGANLDKLLPIEEDEVVDGISSWKLLLEVVVLHVADLLERGALFSIYPLQDKLFVDCHQPSPSLSFLLHLHQWKDDQKMSVRQAQQRVRTSESTPFLSLESLARLGGRWL